MKIHQISDKMNRYIDNTMEIRKLSSPDIEKIGSADEYVQVSRVNALKIRKLSEENREIMKKVISPLHDVTSAVTTNVNGKIFNLFFISSCDFNITFHLSSFLVGIFPSVTYSTIFTLLSSIAFFKE